MQVARQLRQHRFAHGVDALRIDAVERLGEGILIGQFEHQGLECRIELRVAQHGAHRVEEGRVEHCFARACLGADGRQQALAGQALPGFPAVEGVAVVLQQHQQVGIRQRLGQERRATIDALRKDAWPRGVRRVRRERPTARLIVTGCAAQVEPGQFAALAEVDAVLPMVAAQAASLDVRIERAALAHAVQADPTRLRQIVLNLLTNAVKYNRRGGQVRIEAHADGAMVVLEVHDTGRGLTPQQLAHVFEPFNRLGAEREGIEGTGIGLAIVKINVERMGGAVSVRSEAGVGSCFEVRLPVGVVLAPEPTAAAMADAAAVAPTPRAHGARVLYIEDNPVNALIVRELLTQRRDLVLDEAPDGCSGIDSARRMRPNLILLDMQLPDIDGMEVLRRLRADPATAAIPCIALSANAMPDDIQTALSAGFADYWTKPLDFRVFMSALDSLFGKTPA